MAAAGSPSARTYVITYAWLLILTSVEVGMVMAGWPAGAIVPVLLATALSKALLIGLYFMHLKFDRPTVWLLPAVPVLLGLLFVLVLFPDLVFHLTLRM